MRPEKNWTHKFSNAYKNPEALYQFLGWEMTSEVRMASSDFSLFIPERLALKIKEQGPNGALAREFLPHELELDQDLNSEGLIDPIGDKAYHVAPQLIHRYPSRALFTATSICPVHCRYCFRRNELNQQDELFQVQFEQTLTYLRAHPEVSEIIFTGGDPLTLSNERLERLLTGFKTVTSLKHVRFHTRYPVILPERIDSGLISVLTEAATHFSTITIAIHANHRDEFDEECDNAIRRLSQAPIQLLSQTVLLRGVNDDALTLSALLEHFLSLKIRPYYLHHPDRVKGGMHFYLSLQKGREIYGKLRQLLPGWALPHYVIDVPGGHGKIPAFNPETSSYSGQLLSQHGEAISVQEPDFFI